LGFRAPLCTNKNKKAAQAAFFVSEIGEDLWSMKNKRRRWQKQIIPSCHWPPLLECSSWWFAGIPRRL